MTTDRSLNDVRIDGSLRELVAAASHAQQAPHLHDALSDVLRVDGSYVGAPIISALRLSIDRARVRGTRHVPIDVDLLDALVGVVEDYLKAGQV